jgi:hypothetical protein
VAIRKPLVRSILPILLQPRDRFIDEEGVWESSTAPGAPEAAS